MRWVTRKHIHVNRTATSWLIRRFLDPDAEILYVEPAEVAGVQERLGAIGFDAPGATYPHRDDQGRCSFERLVDERLGAAGTLWAASLPAGGLSWIDRIDRADRDDRADRVMARARSPACSPARMLP